MKIKMLNHEKKKSRETKGKLNTTWKEGEYSI
jgi:hypothetical protein